MAEVVAASAIAEDIEVSTRAVVVASPSLKTPARLPSSAPTAVTSPETVPVAVSVTTRPSAATRSHVVALRVTVSLTARLSVVERGRPTGPLVAVSEIVHGGSVPVLDRAVSLTAASATVVVSVAVRVRAYAARVARSEKATASVLVLVNELVEPDTTATSLPVTVSDDVRT